MQLYTYSGLSQKAACVPDMGLKAQGGPERGCERHAAGLHSQI